LILFAIGISVKSNIWLISLYSFLIVFNIWGMIVNEVRIAEVKES
jgi:hypothetical protein